MDETTSDMRSSSAPCFIELSFFSFEFVALVDRGLMVKISKAPKNVVELVQMRNSIDTLPEVINEMQVRPVVLCRVFSMYFWIFQLINKSEGV